MMSNKEKYLESELERDNKEIDAIIQEILEEEELDKMDKEIDEIIQEIQKEEQDTKEQKVEHDIEKQKVEQDTKKCNYCNPLVKDNEIGLVIKKPFNDPEWRPSEMWKFKPGSMWNIIMTSGRTIDVYCNHFVWTGYNADTMQTTYSVYVPCRFTCIGCDETHPGIKYTFSESKVKVIENVTQL